MIHDLPLEYGYLYGHLQHDILNGGEHDVVGEHEGETDPVEHGSPGVNKIFIVFREVHIAYLPEKRNY
jgi:hypothetical protein